MAKDSVCAMNVDQKRPGGTSDYAGKTHYFCSSNCEVEFDKNPSKYVK